MRVILQYGYTVRGSFAQTHIAGDDGIEHQVSEMTFHFLINLIAEAQTIIVHGQQETFDLQVGGQFRLDALDGVEQFGDALEGKELARCSMLSISISAPTKSI